MTDQKHTKELLNIYHTEDGSFIELNGRLIHGSRPTQRSKIVSQYTVTINGDDMLKAMSIDSPLDLRRQRDELRDLVQEFIDSSDNDGYWATDIEDLRSKCFAILAKTKESV